MDFRSVTDAYMATLAPEQIADESWLPGGPSREELAVKVRRLRGLTCGVTVEGDE